MTVGWVAPRAGSFTFDLAGSTYDTVIHVHGDDCSGPELACNDDANSEDQQLWSRVRLTLEEGEVVYLFVDGFVGRQGSWQGDFALIAEPN